MKSSKAVVHELFIPHTTSESITLSKYHHYGIVPDRYYIHAGICWMFGCSALLLLLAIFSYSFLCLVLYA